MEWVYFAIPPWRFGVPLTALARFINEVTLRRARLVLGWMTRLRTGIPPRYVNSHRGPLSLAIHLWVGAMSTGDGFGHRYREETAISV